MLKGRIWIDTALYVVPGSVIHSGFQDREYRSPDPGGGFKFRE